MTAPAKKKAAPKKKAAKKKAAPRKKAAKKAWTRKRPARFRLAYQCKVTVTPGEPAPVSDSGDDGSADTDADSAALDGSADHTPGTES